MFPHKLMPILGILTLTLVLLLCSPWAAMAQFSEQRLIPVAAVQDTSGADPGNDDAPPFVNPIANASEQTLPTYGFMVYGRAPKGYPPDATTTTRDEYVGEGSAEAGILVHVPYGHIPNSLLREPNSTRMPDLETFFDFGGTLELVTPEEEDSTLAERDIVISEIMWAVDRGIDNIKGTDAITVPNPNFDPNSDRTDTDSAPGEGDNPKKLLIHVPQLLNQEIQWIELYNTMSEAVTAKLYFLFTPFVSHPTRDTVTFDGTTYKVLDTVDTLFTGLWKLPGKSGDRPNTAFVSAYRNINYKTVEDYSLSRAAQLAGIPFGANPNSWQATPSPGRRNTDLTIVAGTAVLELLSISTPGAKHVTGIHVGRLTQASVLSDIIVINEVRNDTSSANIDWVELKNVSAGIQQIKDWELSIVKKDEDNELVDTDLVDLPEYELASGEILLLVNEGPAFTPIAGGKNIQNADELQRETRGTLAYVADSRLKLPNTGKFMLLLRSKFDQNGKDKNIQDYAGNGFFEDLSIDMSTQFWPRMGQYQPSTSVIVDYANSNTFGSRDQAWQRKRYQADDGHHKDAWEAVGYRGGLGYDARANIHASPGTPGYENDAIKSGRKRLTDGEVSISEIMYHRGPTGNSAQWIELYNSSLTQAVSLKGWKLRIYNLRDAEERYIGGALTFGDVAILPNQTIIIASKRTASNLPDDRIYKIWLQNKRELNMTHRADLLLNPSGFYLKLIDTGDPELQSDDEVVDEVGNLSPKAPHETVWLLPQETDEQRRSIVRVYGTPFTPNQAGTGGDGPESPNDGLTAENWRLFPGDGLNENFYGHRDDLSDPGHRKGGPLPVVLAGFRPVRMESGEVRISWRTESELDNAGFNILRSESRKGDFKVINVKGIIPGHGTTSEQHLYAYTDTTAKPNVSYYYRIEDVSFSGTRRTLTTARLKGNVSPADKLTTTWSRLKARD